MIDTPDQGAASAPEPDAGDDSLHREIFQCVYSYDGMTDPAVKVRRIAGKVETYREMTMAALRVVVRLGCGRVYSIPWRVLRERETWTEDDLAEYRLDPGEARAAALREQRARAEMDAWRDARAARRAEAREGTEVPRA